MTRTERHHKANGKMLESGISEELTAIKADMTRLREDVAAFCQAIMDTGKSGLDEARSRMSDETYRRLDDLRQRLQSAREYGKETLSSVENKIEEKPLTSMAIAFVVGLFAGKLLHRS